MRRLETAVAKYRAAHAAARDAGANHDEATEALRLAREAERVAHEAAIEAKDALKDALNDAADELHRAALDGGAP